MFYLWPIDRCSNSRTSLCWQSVDPHLFCQAFVLLCILILFLLGSQVIPTLKLIGVGGLLPRMIFHRLEPMFEYPEKWDFPIYIYTVSLFLGFFDVFWRFLTFFDFLCTIAMFFDVFWKSVPSLRYSHFWISIFSVPFKEMGFSFLSIFYLFGRFF